MVESKFVRVLDEGTDMVFIITKFEPSDAEFLALKGWEYSPELTMITNIGNQASSSITKGRISSSISEFRYPPYDIEERSGKLGSNHTTHGLATVVREMNFDEIPNKINLTGLVLTR